jgi:hypothetical protein
MPRIDCFDIIKNNPELVSEFISITEDMPEVEQRKQAIQIVNKLLEASNESLNKVKRKVGQKPQKYNSGVSQDAIDEIIKKYSQPEQKETPQAESTPALRYVESAVKAFTVEEDKNIKDIAIEANTKVGNYVKSVPTGKKDRFANNINEFEATNPFTNEKKTFKKQSEATEYVINEIAKANTKKGREEIFQSLLSKEQTQKDSGAGDKGVPFIKKIFDKIRSITKLNKVQHNILFNIDTKLSKEIADAYEKMKHDPNNPKVKKAYKAMVEETKQQYDALIEGGLKAERWTGKGEPYANSKEMLSDLKENNHLWFLPNESAFGDKDAATKYKDNIGLQDSGITLDGNPLTNSEVFRIVHDAVHGINGNEFGAIGEENATLQHLSMYSDEALPAVVAQTRGQNSWVNFSGVNDSANAKFKEAAKLEKEGKYDEAKKIRKEAQKEFIFAEPKIGLLPNKYNFRYYGTKNSELASKERTNTRSGDGNKGESKPLPTLGYEKNVARESKSFSSRSNSEGRTIRTSYGDIVPKAIHTVKQSLVDGIKKAFPKATIDKELFEVDADIFHKAATKAKSVNEFGAAVDVLSPKEYSKYRLFITEDGLTGIALSPNGDLGSGFDMSGKPRRLPQLLVLGIENGATHANAFHTILPNYYTAFGFKPVARNLWNDALKPEDWNYETFKDFNNGRPDVVHFIWDGGDRNNIHERIGQFDSYSDYHKEQTPVINTWEEAQEIVQQSIPTQEVKADLSVKKILDWKNLSGDERNKLAKELESANIPSERLNNGKLVKKEFGSLEEAKKYTNDKKSQGLNVKTDLVGGKYVVEYKEKGLSTASNDILRGLAAEFDPNIAKRLGYDAAKLGDEIVVFDAKNTKIKSEPIISKEQTPTASDVESTAKALEVANKTKVKRFYPDDKVILTTKDGKEVEVSFRGYNGENKAVIFGSRGSGINQMEVDVSQLRAKGKSDKLSKEDRKELLSKIDFQDKNAPSYSEDFTDKELQDLSVKYPKESKLTNKEKQERNDFQIATTPLKRWQEQEYGVDDPNDTVNIRLAKEHETAINNIIANDKYSTLVSEAYHKAKKDDSNPELVKAVESLISNGQKPLLSTSKPKQSITKEAFNALTTMLKKAFPKVEFIGEKEAREILGDKGIKVNEMRTSDGNVFGFEYKGRVYLDPSMMNADTPIHEVVGHYGMNIIDAMAKGGDEKAQAVIAKGFSLLQAPEGKAVLDEIKANPAYSNLSLMEKKMEALATIIGREGANMFAEGTKPTLSSLSSSNIKNSIIENYQEIYDNLELIVDGDDLTNNLKDLIYPSDVPKIIEDKDIFFKTITARVKQRKDKAERSSNFTNPYGRIKITGLTPNKVVEDFLNNKETKFTQEQYDFARAELDLSLINYIKNGDVVVNLNNNAKVLSNSDIKSAILKSINKENQSKTFASKVKAFVNSFYEYLKSKIPTLKDKSIEDIQRMDNKEFIRAIVGDAFRGEIVDNNESESDDKVMLQAQKEADSITLEYNDKGQHLAPNGKPSNLTEQQAKIVRTNAFKNWFGDWENDPKNASKVVDENGEPLVVYHGSKKFGFNEFLEKQGAKAKSKMQLLFGMHFASSKDDAMIYAKKGGIYDLFLNIKTPIDLSKGFIEKGNPLFDSYLKLSQELNLSKDFKNNLDYQLFTKEGDDGGKSNDIQRIFITQFMLDKYAPSKVYSALKNSGFDGVIYEPYQPQGFNTISKFSQSYISFSPNQIKLADGTNTTFNPNTNDIRFQIIGEIGASRLDNAEMILNDLNVAKQMESAGKTPKEIHLATSWEKGADKKWRFELPDIKSIDKLIFNNVKKGEKVTLYELVGDNVIFKAYPELKDLKVKIGKESIFNASDKTITLSELFTHLSAKSTLIHEMQHAVQNIEGFAYGTTGAREMMSARAYYTDSISQKLFKENKEYRDSYLKASNLPYYVSDTSLEINKEREELDNRLQVIFDDYIKKNPIDENKIKEIAKKLYYANAGEVEARNAQRRMNMTIKERKAKMLLETEGIERNQRNVILDAINGIANSDSNDIRFQASPKTDLQEAERKLKEAWGKYLSNGISFDGMAEAEKERQLIVALLGYLKAKGIDIAKGIGNEVRDFIKNKFSGVTDEMIDVAQGRMLTDYQKLYDTHMTPKNKEILDGMVSQVKSGEMSFEDFINTIDGIVPNERIKNVFISYVNEQIDPLDGYVAVDEEIEESPESPKAETSKEEERAFIGGLLARPINSKNFPNIVGGNKTDDDVLKRITAVTQEDVQDRKVMVDTSYVRVALEDIKEIALQNANALYMQFGEDWQTKVMDYLSDYLNAANPAQAIGILNVISTDVQQKIEKSQSPTERTKLFKLQDKADELSILFASQASLGINARKILRQFAQGGNMSKLVLDKILTEDTMQTIEEINRIAASKPTNEELNNATLPVQAPQTPKSRIQKIKENVKAALSSKQKNKPKITEKEINELGRRAEEERKRQGVQTKMSRQQIAQMLKEEAKKC